MEMTNAQPTDFSTAPGVISVRACEPMRKYWASVTTTSTTVVIAADMPSVARGLRRM